MKYKILTYGHEELREKSVPVKAVTDEIRQLAKDMLETMYAGNGLGLASEQVGRRESICVIDIPPARAEDGTFLPPENPDVPMPLIMINPRILEMEGEYTVPEGCLSFPEIYVDLKRAQKVKVEFLNLKGKEQTIMACGLLSRAVQHELDHLHGVLLVDRMSAIQKVAVSGKLKRLKKQVEE